MNNEISIDSLSISPRLLDPYRHKGLVEELLFAKNQDYLPNTIPLL
jgi:hypothetical protein